MRFGGVIRNILPVLGAAAVLLAAAPARGQIRTIPRERLDSLANPALAPGAGAMRFETLRIDTGDIGEDDGPKSYTFRWKNAGDQPLVITRTNTTCGCAVTEYDRQPALPGQTRTFTVTYHPKGHPGHFQRKIFLFTQLSDKAPTAVLVLAGQVVPSTHPTYAYPHARGSLLLKQEEIRFNGGVLQAESIECLNGGKDTLRIRVDGNLLPPCIEAEFSPAELAPGRLGELIVRFVPSEGRVPQRVPVVLKGLGLSPLQSSITVRIGADSDNTKQRE